MIIKSNDITVMSCDSHMTHKLVKVLRPLKASLPFIDCNEVVLRIDLHTVMIVIKVLSLPLLPQMYSLTIFLPPSLVEKDNWYHVYQQL